MFYVVYKSFLLPGLLSQFCTKKSVSVLQMISYLDHCVFYVQFLFCTLILSCNKKKCQKQFVLENRMLFFLFVLLVFFLCVIVIFINDTTRLSNPVHGFRPFFVSCYWRTIHLIYVIFPLHFVIYKQYCFFLSPGTML